MSIVNLFLNKAPTMNGLEFDAVLENTLKVASTITGYTIASGARVADHRILDPIEWSLVVAMSNNPLRTSLTSFVGALTDNDTSGLLSTVAGLSAGFLSGSNGSRASTTLEALFALWSSGEAFSIDAVDVQLNNMVITGITRTSTAETEGGLIAEIQLQEMPFLNTEPGATQPLLNNLNFNDPSFTKSVANINKGQLVGISTNIARATLASKLI